MIVIFLADSEREGAKDTLKRAQPYRRTDDAYARAGSRERQQLRKLKHLKVAAVMCGKLRRIRSGSTTSSRMIVIFSTDSERKGAPSTMHTHKSHINIDLRPESPRLGQKIGNPTFFRKGVWDTQKQRQ